MPPSIVASIAVRCLRRRRRRRRRRGGGGGGAAGAGRGPAAVAAYGAHASISASLPLASNRLVATAASSCATKAAAPRAAAADGGGGERWRGVLGRGALLHWHGADLALPCLMRVQLPRSTWSGVATVSRGGSGGGGGHKPPDRLTVIRPGVQQFAVSLEHRRLPSGGLAVALYAQFWMVNLTGLPLEYAPRQATRQQPKQLGKKSFDRPKAGAAAAAGAGSPPVSPRSPPPPSVSEDAPPAAAPALAPPPAAGSAASAVAAARRRPRQRRRRCRHADPSDAEGLADAHADCDAEAAAGRSIRFAGDGTAARKARRRRDVSRTF